MAWSPASQATLPCSQIPSAYGFLSSLCGTDPSTIPVLPIRDGIIAPPQEPSCCTSSLSPPYFAYDTLESPSLKAFMRYAVCYLLYRRQHSCVNHKPGWRQREKSHCGHFLSQALHVTSRCSNCLAHPFHSSMFSTTLCASPSLKTALLQPPDCKPLLALNGL